MKKSTKQSIFEQRILALKNAKTHEEQVLALRPLVINWIKAEDRAGTDLSGLIDIINSMAEREGVEMPTDQTAIIEEGIKRGWV